MKIIKNKKAMATSLIIDIWAIIAYFLVFLVVYMSVIASSKLDYKVCVEQLKEEKTMELLNILKTPADDAQSTIAERLALYDLGDLKDAEDKIVEILKKNNLYFGIYCISFDFEEKDSIIISPGFRVDECEDADANKLAEIRFPNKNQKIITAGYYIPKEPALVRLGGLFSGKCT